VKVTEAATTKSSGGKLRPRTIESLAILAPTFIELVPLPTTQSTCNQPHNLLKMILEAACVCCHLPTWKGKGSATGGVLTSDLVSTTITIAGTTTSPNTLRTPIQVPGPFSQRESSNYPAAKRISPTGDCVHHGVVEDHVPHQQACRCSGKATTITSDDHYALPPAVHRFLLLGLGQKLNQELLWYIRCTLRPVSSLRR
jgi:hypothetical protein